jgi:hypothetical protein
MTKSSDIHQDRMGHDNFDLDGLIKKRVSHLLTRFFIVWIVSIWMIS